MLKLLLNRHLRWQLPPLLLVFLTFTFDRILPPPALQLFDDPLHGAVPLYGLLNDLVGLFVDFDPRVVPGIAQNGPVPRRENVSALDASAAVVAGVELLIRGAF